MKGVGEIIVAKHRNGATDTIKLRFIDYCAKFTNLDDPNFSDLNDDTYNQNNPNIITMPSRINDEDVPF